MSSFRADLSVPPARGVRFGDGVLIVELVDGRTLTVPLEWYPRLDHASERERSNWQLIGKGQGIHWSLLDEDLSVEGLLAGRRSTESPQSLERWIRSRPSQD
jgi:hypothetical protein